MRVKCYHCGRFVKIVGKLQDQVHIRCNNCDRNSIIVKGNSKIKTLEEF